MIIVELTAELKAQDKAVPGCSVEKDIHIGRHVENQTDSSIIGTDVGNL